ncbi:hypothetical protein T265_03113 [Opisthorchis viverrini]|uniref:Tetraspanin n=2 Tax=Opisthorchis viverrini TaxID=6198 RepID=A0A075AHU7_OPIVI|nr:hypothetical protein T265_03113 [Opisthorchis viverrini]KER30504.1 hypothetical protein T265_03113 [Opisthorchis viverrini]
MCKAVSGTVIVLINIPFVVISLILITVGALIKWNQDLLASRIVPALLGPDAKDNVRDAMHQLVLEIFKLLGPFGLAIFIFGIFLFVLTFCGIFGVCCKSKVLLGTYATLLLVLFLALLIMTIVFGTRASWFRAQVQELFKTFIVGSYKMDNDNQSLDPLTQLIDMIQQNQHCCGSYSYQDYKENESFKAQSYSIPASCCADPTDRSCWSKPTPKNSYMNTGCFDTLWNVIDENLKIVLYILIGMLVLSFFFAVLAIYLLTRYAREELSTV